MTGEERLWWAILENGIDCLSWTRRMKSVEAARIEQEARDWVASDDRSWPCTFVNICEVLGLNPEYVRSRVLAPTWGQQKKGAVA